MLDRPLKFLLRQFHQVFVQNRRQDCLAQHLAALAPSGKIRILDVGCGSGQIAANLQRRLPESEIHGVDTLVRPETFIPVQAFDGSHLPFQDKSFDYVMLVDVLHHTHQPSEVLKECLRVSRHGVWLKDHLCNSRWDHFRLRCLDFVGNWGHSVALPYNYLSTRQWNQTFEQLGVTPRNWLERLQLYSPKLAWLLENKLHFVAHLEATSSDSCTG